MGRVTGFSLGVSGSATSDEGITYTYDTYSRLNGVVVNGGPSLAYSFVANSNLIAGISDSGSSWAQTRSWLSNRNLLAAISTNYGSTVIGEFQYVSDVLGRRSSKVSTGELYARYPAGGLAEDYTYDARSELTGAETYQSTDPTVTTTPMLGRNFTYTYDQIGSRTASSIDGTSATYTNNALNELTQRTVPGSISVSGLAPTGATVTINGTAVTSGETQGQYYKHNAATDNSSAPQWSSFTVASSLGGSLLRDFLLRQTPEAYTYDADGNLLMDGRWHYDWDAENRLVTMETIGNRPGDPTAVWTSGVPLQKITFSYDYLSRRVDKMLYSWSGSAWVPVSSLGETRFIYDSWNMIGDYDATGGTFGTRLRSYAWGLDFSGTLQGEGGVGGLLATISASGVVNMTVHDGNGNIMGLTDRSTGTINAAYEYSPFGETLRSTGLYAQQNPFRYSSKYTDNETGLICYGRRYYDPRTGRWFSRDPKEELGGLHLFEFVHNNPINRRDFLGFDGCMTDWGGGDGVDPDDVAAEYDTDPSELDDSSTTTDTDTTTATTPSNIVQMPAVTVSDSASSIYDADPDALSDGAVSPSGSNNPSDADSGGGGGAAAPPQAPAAPVAVTPTPTPPAPAAPAVPTVPAPPTVAPVTTPSQDTSTSTTTTTSSQTSAASQNNTATFASQDSSATPNAANSNPALTYGGPGMTAGGVTVLPPMIVTAQANPSMLSGVMSGAWTALVGVASTVGGVALLSPPAEVATLGADTPLGILGVINGVTQIELGVTTVISSLTGGPSNIPSSNGAVLATATGSDFLGTLYDLGTGGNPVKTPQNIYDVIGQVDTGKTIIQAGTSNN